MKRSSTWCVVLCLLVVSGCTRPPPESPLVNQFQSRRDAVTLLDGGQCPQVTITAESELMIRALSVVEDPVRTTWSGNPNPPNPSEGAWHFGRLMTAMAGPNDPEQFVRTWLQEWSAPRTVNGFVVPARDIDAQVVNPWLAASGGTRLDLSRAPFRLLAIVNRIDLRDLSQGSAGEGRFVFGVLGAGGAPLQFTVILEYNLPATTPAQVRAWADDFHALSALPLGSPQYNQALEAITNRFAGRNVAPSRPNGSSINQVRSNEIALAAPWELREFKLTTAGQLRQVTVAQTPDLSLNDSQTLANFINANTSALLAGTHVVPATFNGAPFLGGSSITQPQTFWRAPGVNPEARFQFSVNTCSGCHAGETGTPFLHISPRGPGQVAQLSSFLTGKTMSDPVTAQPRTFNDLDFRASSIGAVLCDASLAPVTVTAPTAGATVRGPTTLTANAPGFDLVEFRVDGAVVAHGFPPTFSATWDSNTIAPGQHTLVAVGVRSTGLVSSAPVGFTVALLNGPDFVVTSFTAPSAVAPASTFTAQLTVCNQGNQFGTAPIDVVVSRDQVFAPFSFPNDDLVLGSTFVTLAPAQCQALSINAFGGLPPAQPGSPAGDVFFLAAVADARGIVPELDEGNNTSASRRIAIAHGPDFTVSVTTSPSAALPSMPFTLTATVCNAGTTAGSPQLAVVLSNDATLALPQDPVISPGVIQVPLLMPAQCATLAVGAQASHQGAFFLGVVADPFGAVAELFEDNNTSAAVPFFLGNGPDLTVSELTLPPAVAPRAAFDATVLVCNVGTAFASANVQLERAGAVIGVGDVFTAQPGQCLTRVVRSVSTVGAGVHPVLARVVNVSPAELNTGNNTATRNLVIGFGPDFTVTVSANAPLNVAPGAPFQVVATVCNRGTVSGGTTVDLVRSNDAVLELGPPSDDVHLGGAFFSLTPGACAAHTFTAPATGSGVSFVGAIADAFNSTAELDETNNTSAALRLAVGLQPDFIVSALSLPHSAQPGQLFTATATVCNVGTASGHAFVELRRSLDATIDPNDQLLGNGTPLTLAAGQCVTQSITGFADAPPPLGLVFIGAVADPFNSTPELDESNNARVGSLPVGDLADFVVSSITAPRLATVGVPFTVTIEVCNRGTKPGVTNVDLLRSPDTFFLMGPGSNDAVVGTTLVKLAAGGCTTRHFSVVSSQVETFNLAAVADPSNNVAEFSESNNQSAVRAVMVL